MEPQLIEAEIIPTAELEKIHATDQALARLRERAEELAAAGATDKAAYEEIHAATMVCVKVRTESLKVAKTLAAPYGEKYDAIIAEGKRIGDHAKESEALLRPLKEAYEAEAARIKEEAAKAEAARIAARINCLNVLGATFNGASYNVHGVYIDAIEVKALPDDEFRELLDSATNAYNAEQTRLAQIEQERQQEAARLELQRQEQEAERIRLQAIADEQKKQQDELQARLREVEKKEQEAENARLQAEREEQKRIDDARKADADMRQAFQDKADEDQRARLQKQAEADKKKADKERSRRLAKDKNLLSKYFVSVGNSMAPVLENSESLDFQIEFDKRLKLLVSEFTERLVTL